MAGPLARRWRKDRQSLLGRAEAELRRRGFQRQQVVERDQVWQGRPFSKDLLPVRVTVNLRPDFPASLPQVGLESPQQLRRRIPHVGPDGTICIAPRTGLVLDERRPEALIHECLVRAEQVVHDGLAGRGSRDVEAEFVSYWPDSAVIWSWVQPSGHCRPISWAATDGPNSEFIVAESPSGLKRRVGHLPAQKRRYGVGLLVPLQVPLVPPWGLAIPAGWLLKHLPHVVTSSTESALFLYLRRVRSEAVLLIELTLKEGSAMVGVWMRLPTRKARRRAFRALRGGRWLTRHERRKLSQHATLPSQVRRLDAAYLLPRGGARMNLAHRRVVVVGVGAVGSQLAVLLGGMGVGTLWLIDPEPLTHDNIHRHYLGIDWMGRNKTEAVGDELRRRFPHIRVHTRSVSFDQALAEEPSMIEGADLVVFATGDCSAPRSCSPLTPVAPRTRDHPRATN